MTVSEVAAYLRAHDKYLILTHRRPDGDTLGCAAALCAMLRQMGKTAGILYNRETTEHFEQYVEQYWVADDFDYETVVSVDLAALSLFPDNAEMFKTRVDLAIDHHPSYEGFGKESCVHPECAACGEILCELAQELGQLTPEVALPLYVAVSTDTGCFVYSNVTANTHRVAAALMETGIDYKAANKLHFRTKSKKRLALEGELLRTMEFYDEDRVVIVAVPQSLAKEHGAFRGRHGRPCVPRRLGRGHGLRCDDEGNEGRRVEGQRAHGRARERDARLFVQARRRRTPRGVRLPHRARGL